MKKLPQIEQIIVVEGRADENAVKRAADAEVITTSGFGISKKTWRLIEKASDGPGIIILTDPDFAGESIRRRIEKRFPGCRHAYLSKEDAARGGDIGIENAAPESIIAALDKARCTRQEAADLFSMEDLFRFGLAGTALAAQRRNQLGKALGIGYANTKTFLSRLNRYGITREEFCHYGQTLFSGDDKTDHE